MAEAQAGAATPQMREASPAISPPDSAFKVPAILVVLVAGLILRLLLATFPGFGIDVGTFQAWSQQMAAGGPWDFYDTDFFTDYAPGYLYVLWFIGELHEIFTFTPGQYEYILKLPSIIADVASAYLLYRLLDSQRMEVRIASALGYLLFPATLFIGAVWGQVDSLLALFLLLSVYFLGRGRPIVAGVAYVSWLHGETAGDRCAAVLRVLGAQEISAEGVGSGHRCFGVGCPGFDCPVLRLQSVGAI